MSQDDNRWHGALTARVTELRGELGDRLSSHWLSTADELLQDDEPNEALLQLAGGIAEEQVPVDEAVRTFIETSAIRLICLLT